MKACWLRQCCEEKTKGYKDHHQLLRSIKHTKLIQAIGFYFHEVGKEAELRGYNFDASKIENEGCSQLIQTTSGQLEFEIMHLLNKLMNHSTKEYDFLSRIDKVDPHPIFQIITGEIEVWEER